MNLSAKFNPVNYPSTASYIMIIIFLNLAFSYFPKYTLYGMSFSLANVTAGAVYLVRDFAQREIKNFILIAMVIATFISYLLAEPNIALASLLAFAIGELLDFLIFTFNKVSLSKRLLHSSIVSSPIDTGIFLYLIGQLNTTSFIVMTLSKFIGIGLLWLLWYVRNNQNTKSTLRA